MKNRSIKLLSLAAALIVLFSSCDDNTDEPVVLETITTEVTATSYTDWVYYSLSQDTIVAVTDPATSNAWDLGFMRNHIRTNGGSSGNGNGGVLDAGVVDFDAYSAAPETGYLVDDSVSAFNMTTMEYSNIAASSVLETWGAFNDAMPPVFTTTNKVFVIKTAEGKYAKVMFMSYYGSTGSGQITFKYVYQPDGSLKLKE